MFDVSREKKIRRMLGLGLQRYGVFLTRRSQKRLSTVLKQVIARISFRSRAWMADAGQGGRAQRVRVVEEPDEEGGQGVVSDASEAGTT